MDKVIDSKVVDVDYRVTTTSEGLWIEVLAYHAQPLFLSREQLAEFGLHTHAEEPQRPKRARRRKAPKVTPENPV